MHLWSCIDCNIHISDPLFDVDIDHTNTSQVKCLHEIFFDAAIKDAERLDEYFKKNGKAIGPLHGLPVSLKDQMHVKGVETTMGYVGVSHSSTLVITFRSMEPDIP